MTKRVLLGSLLGVLMSVTCRATVITWTLPDASGTDLSDATSAQLVYVSSGALSFDKDTGAINNGTALGSAVTGGALADAWDGVTMKTTVPQAYSSGSYYLVLLNGSGGTASYSASSVAASGVQNYYTDETDPSALVTPSWAPVAGSFSSWAAVPEPSSVALLIVGAAVAVLRRKRRLA